jgi:hypothetical protein
LDGDKKSMGLRLPHRRPVLAIGELNMGKHSSKHK